MTAERALEHIYAIPRFGRGETLEPVRRLLAALRDPQDALRYIHVAGTNGKGSISTMCASVLQENKLKVGLYTSPFINDFRERFQINGKPVSPAAFAHAATEVLHVLDRLPEKEQLSQFDVVTAIGFLLFAEAGCDIVVLECGLGGRLDATNVIRPPCVAVIGNIGYDHTEQLGNTIEAITAEKCGILKPGTGTVICAPQDYPAARATVERFAKERNIPAVSVEDADIFLKQCNFSSLTFTYRGRSYTTGLSAAYQARNACTALQALNALKKEGFTLTVPAVERGLRQAYIPARFELMGMSPQILLDGAHNLDGLRALRGAIEAIGHLPGKLYCLCGMLREKAPHEALSAFFASPLVREKLCEVVTVTPPTPRACPAEELADILRQIQIPLPRVTPIADMAEALSHCLSAMGEQDTLLCFGSLYSMGELRRQIRAHYAMGEKK